MNEPKPSGGFPHVHGIRIANDSVCGPPYQSLAARFTSGLVHDSKSHRSEITSDIHDETIYQ
jgi:hypothetical protein